MFIRVDEHSIMIQLVRVWNVDQQREEHYACATLYKQASTGMHAYSYSYILYISAANCAVPPARAFFVCW